MEEINISTLLQLKSVGEDKKPKKVLIATLYNADPVVLAITRLGPDKVVLVFDKHPNKELSEALERIHSTFGKVIEIEEVRTDAYDVVGVARACVDIIDEQGKNDEIYANITSGRKTRAIGLLFAAYARADRVRKIAYNPEEDKKAIVWLPKLSFKLTESQKLILEAIEKDDFENIKELADKLGAQGKLSVAMVYRAIAELEDLDFVRTEPKLELTDGGRIAKL
ncbi:MAG: DUF6293 family protein [Candidatus Micrarchaeota archaeon]|nr:DUF6293 family protein [Candidatus Micrarchaeota archaeon]